MSLRKYRFIQTNKKVFFLDSGPRKSTLDRDMKKRIEIFMRTFRFYSLTYIIDADVYLD